MTLFSTEHKNAVGDNYSPNYLKNVFYNATEKELVSCNSRILLLEPKELNLNEDCYFNSVTMEKIETESDHYPDYQKIIPTDKTNFNIKENYRILKNTERKSNLAKELIELNGRYFDKIYLDTCLKFVGEIKESYQQDETCPMLINGSNGRKALVMPIRQFDNSKFVEIKSGTNYSPAPSKTTNKDVFVVFDHKDGQVLKCFNKLKTAEQYAEAFTYAIVIKSEMIVEG